MKILQTSKASKLYKIQVTEQSLLGMQRDAVSRKKTEADKEIEILNLEVCSTCVICAPTVAV